MKEAGIEILEQQERTLTKEEAREFYAHKKDEVRSGILDDDLNLFD